MNNKKIINIFNVYGEGEIYFRIELYKNIKITFKDKLYLLKYYENHHILKLLIMDLFFIKNCIL